MKIKTSFKNAVSMILVLAMMIPGVYLGQSLSDTSIGEVQAEETTPKFLDVKVQAKETDGGYTLRFVSSVDTWEGYSAVGFDITDYNGVSQTTSTDTVYNRIGASSTELDYHYSPKVVNTASEWFISATLFVPSDKIAEDIHIKAFYMQNGTKTYGRERIVSVNDGIIATQFSMYVDTALTDDTYTTTLAGVSGVEKLDANNVRITLASGGNKVSWDAVTSIPLTGNNGQTVTASYRNLETTKAVDTSWYNETDTEFVIATAGEFYGLASLVDAGNTFNSKSSGITTETCKTIYLVCDIDADGSAAKPWTPIGRQKVTGESNNRPFRGRFDGQNHTISGIYLNATANMQGLFGLVDIAAVISNFTLADSTINANSYADVGAVA